MLCSRQLLCHISVESNKLQNMENHEDKLYCPNCGSSQLVANKKGFGAGKALTGAVLTGGVGLLAGFIGSGKVKITCLKCGCQWKPGELKATPISQTEIDERNRQLERQKEIEAVGNPFSTAISWFAVVVFVVLFIVMCAD